jgi:hypothetical protein
MAKLIGHFYFKITDNGNLIGEFSNNQTDSIYTESADSINTIKKDKNNYIGEYCSTWREGEHSHFANLKISHGSNERIFILEWTSEKDNYKGKGMLCDNILIGDYQ